MNKLLLKACENGQKGVVLAFLKKDGIDVNAVDEIGFSPLHYSCKKGYKDIVKLLLEKDADATLISNQSITPLHMAMIPGNKEIVQMLVDAGADVNATDKEGKTPLIYGIEAKKVEAVKFLIGLGADVSIMDNKNNTALDYANAFGLTQLIEEMSAPDMYTADSFGNTPLHQSCFNEQSEVVNAMLKRSEVDVNAVNNDKMTPLFIAVMRDNLLIAETLLKAGADPNLKDNKGNSPLHLHQEMRMSQLLRSFLSTMLILMSRTAEARQLLL